MATRNYSSFLIFFSLSEVNGIYARHNFPSVANLDLTVIGRSSEGRGKILVLIQSRLSPACEVRYTAISAKYQENLAATANLIKAKIQLIMILV